MSSSLLIVNAQLVNEGQITQNDVLIRNGRIEAIGKELSREGVEVLDAQGRHLLPGMIDDQVHFANPALLTKAIWRQKVGRQSQVALPVLWICPIQCLMP